MQTFVCCFSVEEDSLPMWIYHTKGINNQRYNIEFDDKQLVESVLRKNDALNGCSLAFGIVDYSKDNDSEYSKIIIREMLSAMDLAISKLFLTVAKNAMVGHSSNVDESSLFDWGKRIASTEEKQKLSDLPIYFYNGEKCRFEKNSSGHYLYFIKQFSGGQMTLNDAYEKSIAQRWMRIVSTKM